MNKIIFSIFLAFFFTLTYAVEDNSWTLNSATEQGHFTITLQPNDVKPEIGGFHNWVIDVTDNNGKSLEDAEFNIDGGMVSHGHGLPSQPTVTQYLGDGKYLIEGMLFNMAGAWTLIIAVKKDGIIDSARFDITLEF